ncbi:MAG: hypothetical protein NVSMB66_7800 [Candidatus Doudnabacteria bacterium]
MKQLIKHVWNFISTLFDKVVLEVKDVALPVATQVVSVLKELTTLDTTDFIGHLADKFGGAIWEDKLRILLPKILLELQLVGSVVSHTKPDGTPDDNAIIADFISKLKLSTDRTKDAMYHDIAAMLVVDLADGHISWSEAVVLVEYFYKHQIQK